MNMYVYVCASVCDCVCERRRVVTLRGSFTVEKRGGWFTRKGGDGAAGWVVSKEIDSSVASALIFPCILNVIFLFSLALSRSLSLSLSLSRFRSIFHYLCRHTHTPVIIDLAA
jgi:general stress protein CsbA